MRHRFCLPTLDGFSTKRSPKDYYHLSRSEIAGAKRISQHAVPERTSCTSTPSTNRAHPAWRLCFSSSTANPACASVPTRRTPQFLAVLPTSFPVPPLARHTSASGSRKTARRRTIFGSIGSSRVYKYVHAGGQTEILIHACIRQ